jgi:hypothetical protein
MKKSILYVGIAILVFFSQLCLNSPVFGETTTTTMTTSTSIVLSNPPTHRILLQFDLPSVLTGSTIDFVKLSTPPVLSPGDSIIVGISGYMVINVWNEATVTWTAPWSTPGGDFDSTKVTLYTLDSEDNPEIFLDVTQMVQSWLAGISNNGIILIRNDWIADEFDQTIANKLLQGLSQGVVTYYYTAADTTGP